MLLVIAAGWASSSARLQRFERESLAANWHPVGRPIVVSLGRCGLAWGRGLQRAPAEPAKREGDGRAPAGIFAIPELFGNGGPDSPLARGARLPYRQATPDLKAIDDPASVHYNRIVDRSSVTQPDWVSCEEMLRSDQRYALGAVVAHNREQVPGAGSCIFLHVWESQDVPTAGCTAMALADMTEIVRWLDGAAAPLLVQLPQAEYERWRAAWSLPALASAE